MRTMRKMDRVWMLALAMGSGHCPADRNGNAFTCGRL